MKRPLFVAGNWKMNKNARESIDFMHELLREIEDEEQIYFACFHKILICLPRNKSLQEQSGLGAQIAILKNLSL